MSSTKPLYLVTATGARYRPNNTDRLWLLRAVEAEGEPRRAVAAALINRFLWLRQHSSRYPTLADFVQAYAAPVNPRRMRGGDIWEANWRIATGEGKEKLLRAHARREEHRRRRVFSDRTRDAVEYALTTAPALSNVTDYAAHDHEPSHALTLITPGERGVNALYTADRDWPGYQPDWERDAVSSIAGPLIALGVLWLVVAGVKS